MTTQAFSTFTQTSRMPVAVLASGGGSNLSALIARANDDDACFRIAVVVVNVPDAPAIVKAQNANIPVRVISHRDFADRASFERAMLDALAPHRVELVVLAGFMRVLTSTFIDAHPNRVVNVHPALLPSFPGLHGARQALDAGVRITGCTVHIVDGGVDTGPILAQAAVAIHDDDDERSLVARIQKEEHRLLPTVVDHWARGGATMRNGRVVLKGLRENVSA